MANIKLMSNQLANMIAAGEVVEQPQHVIKWLVENAMDAKAKHITIDVKDEGLSLIRVEDDGTFPYVIPFGYGALFNSSNDPNIIYKWDNENKILIFRTIRDIESDEELFLNYEYNRMIVNTDLFTFN